MSVDARSLFREALALPEDDRADLAAELLASLEEPAEEDVAAAGEAWADEIERRARRVLAGETQGEDWTVVRQRLADGLTGG